MSDIAFESARKPIFNAIVDASKQSEISPSEAYKMYLQQEAELGIPTASLYVSTAISSGGYVRDPNLDPKSNDDRRKIIEANNRVASLILGQMVSDNDYMNSENMLVTTELGKVERWGDSKYMQFWMYGVSGVDTKYAEDVDELFADDTWREDLEKMNNYHLSNDERWPAYRQFTHVLVDKLSTAKRIRVPIDNFLQLVDVQMSLGCNAEAIAAHEFDAALLAPEIKRDALPADSELAQRLGTLAGWGAKVGLDPAIARLAVVDLG